MSDQIKRNPHPDFKKVEASRPAWDDASRFRFTRTVDPDWAFGHGSDGSSSSSKHIAIDPYAPGRPDVFNYKLLISGIVPRPIAFLSTRSADGSSTNLAPFSYFNVMSHDPPLFVVGFASGIDAAVAKGAKDTLRNLVETREAVVNIISESFLEAANATSIDAPYGVSEWDVAGLTPVRDCETVRCARVAEAVFSVEVKVDELKEHGSKRDPSNKTSTIAILEGTRFWVREDALNEEKNLIDPAILRPISRLGGISYARTTEALELPRPKFEDHLGGHEGFEKLKNSKRS
ncbi:flavin reductase like domain-containing protein [Hirsutella rhossiliensis]|uniref:Flavin reductase like domain-containing protein n=1 Tax=Hirsutella rhossiliensis TaxID=111463 RepID=A0A9P8N557_9HYPO|nr:flavin reductase like domain-containing protein [Hirsutella rhossiliensis]KAH0965969.1 flavin reductase like domain-containing protein [Hirsutella rhossiliensis]